MNGTQRKAVIDIGSNSVRLVVFGGAPRAPIVLYNEKLAAGLGGGVVRNGQLDKVASDMALRGLARFALVAKAWDVSWLRVLATAAVREARNGAAFLEAVKALGLPIITPVFLEEKAGEAKIVSFWAKKARGAMARFIVQNRITDGCGVLEFDLGGYRFDPSRSTRERPVFLRPYPAA